MSSQAHTALWILRWTWKTCLPKRVPGKELPRVPLFFLLRPLCSSQPVPPLSTPAQTIQPGRKEITLQSLAEMGFSEKQAVMVYEAANKNRCKHDLPVLTVLFSLGLNPGTVLKVLEKCPELYSLKEAQLQQRVLNLRKLGLLEGSLQRVISLYPRILSFPVKRMSTVSRLLREKCQFTAQQMADILRDSPHVVEEEPARLEYMFQSSEVTGAFSRWCNADALVERAPACVCVCVCVCIDSHIDVNERTAWMCDLKVKPEPVHL
ncbi:hypothetical protein HF521_010209 [Silurus meridionalis]|uniref:Uncharacterized protein n=1 Tax=Silurus meridionalis TaxID=175797 RepID=A0A8T0ALI1_SILME|nr:hypothetical protein HF521_010209 [Silurus meridionalis]